MAITINGTKIDFTPGETVLEIASRAGVHIPHLCTLDGAPSPVAACRLCLVEVEGSPRLQTSCTLRATDGLALRTHTPRVLAVRRNVVELLLASHPKDCLVCSRRGDCELSRLAAELGVRERRYSGIARNHPLDLSSPSIVRDPNKCVLCGRCVTTCQELQGVGAIDFVGRGFTTRVAPAFHPGLNVSGCVFCGQCIRACPTGALADKSHVDAVAAALADPGAVVVAQIAPAVPVTLMEELEEASSARVALERLAAALKRVGFGAVFDTAFAADLTVVEEVAELVARIEGGGALPMFTSCSPAWVRWVELHRPALAPHLSTCKSPQQMAGALIKAIYPAWADLGDRRLVCVSIMPCTAKKHEAQEQGDVDFVLTTRELQELLERFGLRLGELTARAPLDPPFSEATGAGRLFGGTGGVMEAAIRTAYRQLAGAELPGSPKVAPARGLEGVRTFALDVGGRALRFAVVSGLGRARELVDTVLAGKSDLHFVEVMSCPGGCAAGGGQPLSTDAEALRRRLERLHEADRRSRVRVSHRNEEIQALYESTLGAPLGEASHRLLHRRYLGQAPHGCAGRHGAE